VNDSRTNEILVRRILSGKQVFSYSDNFYELRKPSLDLQIQADVLYQSAYDDNIFNNFLLSEDLEPLLYETDILFLGYDTHLVKLSNTLDNAKIDLFQNYYDRSKKNKNKHKIQTLKREIADINQKKHSLDYLTLEHYCDNIRNEFLISHSLYFYKTDNLVFSDVIDPKTFGTLSSCISNNIIDIPTYKKLARSDYWKNYWNINKSNILNEPINEWSEEQKTLINISIMYDRIHEHPECPKEDIINDDDALDGWMVFQKRENERQKKEKGVENMMTGKLKNASEVFLMAQDKGQAQDILSINSDQSLATLKEKVNFVSSSSGPIKDAALPDVKQKIIQQLKGKG
jgi:hypothetical protein